MCVLYDAVETNIDRSVYFHGLYLACINASLHICQEVYPHPFDGVYAQIWCSVTLVTQIRNRVVSIWMVHLTGTAKKCVELAQKRDEQILSSIKPNKQQLVAMEAAQTRLQAVDV